MLADCVLQRLAAVEELLARLRFRLEDEPRMREGVIADDMSCLRYCAGNVGALPHIAADHEERCLHAMLRQHVEQVKRVRIVRPVVVGQGDLPASPDSMSERLSEPLARRRHGLVTRSCRGGSSRQSGRQSDEGGNHDRIVN